MTDDTEVSTAKSPIKLNVAPIDIRSAPGEASIPRAKPSGGPGGFLRPFANDQINSRLASPLPNGPWSIHRQTPLDSNLEPFALLCTGDRILVQGRELWQMLDSEGKVLAFHRLGASDVHLDPELSLFYLADTSGYVAARRLADGGEEFVLSAYSGDDFRRSLIARQANRMTIVSVEMRIPHRIPKPDRSVLEVQDLGEKKELSSTGRLRSARRLSSLKLDTALLLTALNDGTIILATSNWIYFVDENLHVRTALRGEFEPIALSLDEKTRIYLLVRIRSHKALWVLTEQGHRVMSFVFPAELPQQTFPPIVGYDHQVYLVIADRVVAVSSSGKLLWERTLQGKFGGATVTADDQLLVSEGSRIVAYGLNGQSTIQFDFGRETLSTPPVLMQGGKLLVATAENFFQLTSPARGGTSR